jgi:hypothetical protein
MTEYKKYAQCFIKNRTEEHKKDVRLSKKPNKM